MLYFAGNLSSSTAEVYGDALDCGRTMLFLALEVPSYILSSITFTTLLE